jgi:G6PDH family F420-dependent oxidoreductase
MPEFGYALSSEQHPPNDLVENARRAEEAGFTFALISDHFHPWVDEQGHSDEWPVPDARLEMLGEAIAVIRQIWEGGYQTFRGKFYDVEQARLYTLPEEPAPIAVAAAKPHAAGLAGRAGDALISTAPEASLVEAYREAGGDGPRYAQITVCWAESEDVATQTAHRVWPNAALEGDLGQELPLPLHFEQAVATVSQDDVAETVVCGPDVERYAEQVQQYVEAGFDHLYFHQVGRARPRFRYRD